MRNIKFRVWLSPRNGYDGEMFYIDDWYWYEEEGIREFRDFKILNYTLLQYTGINDKNKKEIYEGDILEYNGERGFVHFCAGAFFIDGAGPTYDHVKSVTPDILEDWVVIGNIYENTHLLDYK